MEDIKLIEQAQAGDKKSLTELIKKYESTVYNFSYKICRDKDRAENTMQETFLSMVKSLKQFKGDSKLSTWLYTVVSNHCLMLARTESKHAYTSFDDEDAVIDESKFTDWKAAR
jgi:RNA polymerase sigma-70 factor (ECF subfamily)